MSGNVVYQVQWTEMSPGLHGSRWYNYRDGASALAFYKTLWIESQERTDPATAITEPHLLLLYEQDGMKFVDDPPLQPTVWTKST